MAGILGFIIFVIGMACLGLWLVGLGYAAKRGANWWANRQYEQLIRERVQDELAREERRALASDMKDYVRKGKIQEGNERRNLFRHRAAERPPIQPQGDEVEVTMTEAEYLEWKAFQAFKASEQSKGNQHD